MDFGGLLKDGWDKVSKTLAPWAIFMLLAMLLAMTIVLIPTVVRGVSRAALDFVRTGKEPEYSELWNFEDYLQFALLCVVMAAALTVGYSLLVIPGVILNTWWLYASFYMADKRLEFWPAMTQSKDAVTRTKLVDHIILLLIVNVINYAGGAVCGLGLLISLPLSMVLIALSYEKLGAGAAPAAV